MHNKKGGGVRSRDRVRVRGIRVRGVRDRVGLVVSVLLFLRNNPPAPKKKKVEK